MRENKKFEIKTNFSSSFCVGRNLIEILKQIYSISVETDTGRERLIRTRLIRSST